MAQVFFSYAAEDRARVESLVRAIESFGLTVWWDRRIGMGSSFDVVIERELDAASCVVVVWSSNSVASEWVRTEANEGAERGILVPVLIDDVRPPLAFRRTQAALLRGWPTGSHDQTMGELIRSVRDVVAKQLPAPVQTQQVAETSHAQIVVAVLPLADRSPERNMAYLCEGLAEDLMNALFSVGGLRVLAATDTFPFKDSSTGIAEIGASLGATVVLEGSVQRAGDRLAISTRLIEVAEGVTVYSERWVRSNDDVFDLQAEIATKVVEGLRTRLGLAGVDQPLADSRMTDPAAYDLYKQAMTESPNEAGGITELRRAVLLEWTIALDPHFARAYTDLVMTYTTMSEVPSGAGSYARSAALLAQLESNNPDDPAIWDVRVQQEVDMAALADRCHAAIRKGVRVHAYPHPTGLHDVRSAYARALSHSGLHRDALGYLALIDRTGEPNLSDTWLSMCGCLIACGEFERAIALCARIRESPSAYLTAAAWEVAARVALNDLDGAAEVPHPYMTDYRTFMQPIVEARRDPAYYVGDEESNKSDALDMRAYCLLAIGETERGLDHLERALAAFGTQYHWMAFRLPIFRPLFDANVGRHPRYRAILTALRIDATSREQIRAQAATLTSITGVEVGPPTDP